MDLIHYRVVSVLMMRSWGLNVLLRSVTRLYPPSDLFCAGTREYLRHHKHGSRVVSAEYCLDIARFKDVDKTSNHIILDPD